MLWEFQKQKHENSTKSVEVWEKENTQIVEATVSLPLARKQSLMSVEYYVVGALKFGFMTPQDWLLTNRNKFLSLLCTTNSHHCEEILQVAADIRFQTCSLVKLLITGRDDCQSVHELSSLNDLFSWHSSCVTCMSSLTKCQKTLPSGFWLSFYQENQLSFNHCL